MECRFVPHPRNFCGGAFQDWLEVNLTNVCNGRCSWCVEQAGWHPDYHAPWHMIADVAIASGRRNIILLGGEPTLHPDIGNIIKRILDAGKRAWITTNGSRLSAKWIKANLQGVFGVNISVHHYDLARNADITGLLLDEATLHGAVAALHEMTAVVRFNCNCIAGQIDSVDGIRRYIEWAKAVGSDKIRFAELKGSDGLFVDLAALLDHRYGLNNNPFQEGCNSDAVIDGMPINFRQMCGMQTLLRPCPKNPKCCAKKVLYYDGNMYNGWQTQKQGEEDMDTVELVKTLEAVKAGKTGVLEAAAAIRQSTERAEAPSVPKPTEPAGGGFCQY